MSDLLVVAQGQDKRLGVTLTVSQQEQPVYLSLLHDHLVGLFSNNATMEP